MYRKQSKRQKHGFKPADAVSIVLLLVIIILICIVAWELEMVSCFHVVSKFIYLRNLVCFPLALPQGNLAFTQPASQNQKIKDDEMVKVKITMVKAIKKMQSCIRLVVPNNLLLCRSNGHDVKALTTATITLLIH